MQLGSQAMIGPPWRDHSWSTLDIVPGVGHGLVEQAVGDQRPAAAAQARRAERDRRSRPDRSNCDRGRADLGLEVVGEGVGEEQDRDVAPSDRTRS